MRIQRAKRQPNTTPLMLLGCLLFSTITALFAGVVILLALGPRLPGIALQAAGFNQRGTTDEIFRQIGFAGPPRVDGSISVSDASVSLGQYGQHSLPSDGGYSLMRGTINAIPGALLRVSESGLISLCVQYSQFCSTSNDRFRNARVDFRNGGAIIYGEAYVRELGLWLPLGLVLQVDESGRQLRVAGLDVQGDLYQVPAGTLADFINQIEAQANSLLNQLTVDIGGQTYRLDRLQPSDIDLAVILR